MNDELIEELARNIYDLESTDKWDHTTEGLKQAYRESIRKALVATGVQVP